MEIKSQNIIKVIQNFVFLNSQIKRFTVYKDNFENEYCYSITLENSKLSRKKLEKLCNVLKSIFNIDFTFNATFLSDTKFEDKLIDINVFSTTLIKSNKRDTIQNKILYT